MGGKNTGQAAALERALAAAVRRDAAGYFTEVAASLALDGITKSLRRKWPSADHDAVHHVTAQAADAMYARAADGGTIESPGRYLWGTAKKLMIDWHHEHESYVPYDPEFARHQEQPDLSTRPDRASLRAEALRWARQFLPKLGELNTQRIMEFVFECIEKERFDIDNPTIGAALGLTLETVKRCKSRGFERLRREARAAGVTLKEALPAELEHDDTDDENNETEE